MQHLNTEDNRYFTLFKINATLLVNNLNLNGGLAVCLVVLSENNNSLVCIRQSKYLLIQVVLNR
jgi:hypothetical protein